MGQETEKDGERFNGAKSPKEIGSYLGAIEFYDTKPCMIWVAFTKGCIEA